MDNWIDRRAVVWTERLVVLLAVSYLFLHTLPRAWGKLNTDFPNYYLSAQLAHQGSDTARMYEWIWLQREKDHRSIDIPMIGLIPITPFSTLIFWPLTGLAALTAKHVWLLVNLALLVPLCRLLHSMTGLAWRHIALVIALSFPLHRNLLFGQFYLFLLVLIVAACWAYLGGRQELSGALIAVAAACKIFPLLFVVFFIQRRAWRALAAVAVTGLMAAAISIAVFGWNVHRTYLHEILPWTLRGEGMPPYVLSAASLSTVLHCLFLPEPQWNPHPWHPSVLWYALLQPTLPLLFLLPAILLIRREDRSSGRILLEWSSLLTASLAISTMPASYHFVLMAFPVCVLAALLLKQKRYGWLALLLLAYLGIGFPMPAPRVTTGLAILLDVPRLFLMLAVLLGCYGLMWTGRRTAATVRRDWTRYGWAFCIAVSALLGIRSTFQQQQAVRQEYAYRLPFSSQALLGTDPWLVGTDLYYVAAMQDGYHLMTANQNSVRADISAGDDLSFSADTQHLWAEKAGSVQSAIVDLNGGSGHVVPNAFNPLALADGRGLAFLRADRGRARLILRNSLLADEGSDTALTPVSLNVYEASFLSPTQYAFSAVESGSVPQVYLTDQTHTNARLTLDESRYPALSPDGHWLAYSHLDHGSWNLWVRDEATGATRRIGDVPCNQMQPSWTSDSKTLLYATDCGRSLWFTAPARRQVIP